LVKKSESHWTKARNSIPLWKPGSLTWPSLLGHLRVVAPVCLMNGVKRQFQAIACSEPPSLHETYAEIANKGAVAESWPVIIPVALGGSTAIPSWGSLIPSRTC
jgi:hypothetical protein